MGRGGSTSDFFNFIDTQNNAIAARESGEKPPIPDGVGRDRHQIERMEQRREEAAEEGRRIGARPRARSRPVTAKIVRGHMENPGA
jgi:hypothetical protein